MPKIKTHKATARRFQITGTGKVLRTKGGKSHNRRNRAKRVARDYDEMIAVSKPDSKRIKSLIPYAR
ncbi:MAG TPA: 50S ribosomal protein L35 [Chloroflexota bacterium]|jgi:large subunit ribosomal protein L35